MSSYSCRNNHYTSACRIGVNTTKELCGICLESILYGHEPSRRRKHHGSSGPFVTCGEAQPKQTLLCNCSSGQKFGQHRQSPTMLSTVADIVDSMCTCGVNSGAHVSTANGDSKGHSSHQNSSSQRQRQHAQPQSLDAMTKLTNRTDVITAGKPNKKIKQHSGQTPSQTQMVGESKHRRSLSRATSSHSSKRQQSYSSQDDAASDQCQMTPSPGMPDMEANRALTKEPNTKLLVSSSHQSSRIPEQLPRSNVSKHRKKSGTTDSHHSLLDDSSSTGGISILDAFSKEDDNPVQTLPTNDHTVNIVDANQICTKRINDFLHNLSKEKVIAHKPVQGCPNMTDSCLDDMPTSLPPLKFEPRTPKLSTGQSAFEARDDDDLGDDAPSEPQRRTHPPTSSSHSSEPVPISSRIHVFGKHQDKSLMGKKESSKAKNMHNLDGSRAGVECDSDEDDEDDITGPRLAKSGTLDTLDSVTNYADTQEEPVIRSPVSVKSAASAETRSFSNIRGRSRAPTPRHRLVKDVPLASPTAGKSERKEFYVVKEKLQWTTSKLEATEYELSVMKGIKDLYQRELECKALECKLAQWRLNHTPLTLDAPVPPIPAASPAGIEQDDLPVAPAPPQSPCVATIVQQQSGSLAPPLGQCSHSFETCAQSLDTSTICQNKLDPAANATGNTLVRVFAGTIAVVLLALVLVLSCQSHGSMDYVVQRCGQDIVDGFLGRLAEGNILAKSLVLFSSSLAMELVEISLAAVKCALAFVSWIAQSLIEQCLEIIVIHWASFTRPEAGTTVGWVRAASASH